MQPLEYEFESDETIPCRMSTGWAEAGKTGIYFGCITVNGRRWLIVLWDDEEDPSFTKDGSIDVAQVNWNKP